MKKLFLILALGYAVLPFLAAQSSVWKVEGKGSSIYIGGTMHLLTPEDYPLPGEFDSAYVWSDVLVLEADLKKMEDPLVVQNMMSMAMYQDERTLKGVLSEAVYNGLKAESEKLGISLTPLSKFKPAMVMLIISVTKMQKSGNTSAGVDQHYLSKAGIDDRPLLFFETVESQLEILFGDEEENEDQAVMQFLKNLDQMDQLGADIKAGWLHGSDKIFKRLQKEMKSEYPDVYKKVLTDRNISWMQKIDTFLDNGDVEFILVGALHVYGGDGVLKLLKKRGYRVTRLTI